MVLNRKYRQWVYVFTVVAMVATLAWTFLASTDLSAAADAAVKLVGAFASVLALLNLTPKDQSATIDPADNPDEMKDY